MAEFVLSAFADEASKSVEGQIAALTRNGIPHIEPRGLEGKSVMDLTDEEIIAYRDALKDAGITTYSFGSPIGKYDIDADFDAYIPTVARALEITKLLGAENMRMFSFFVPQERVAECKEEVLRRIGIMLDMAREAGVRLCHENESRIFGQMPDEVDVLLNTFPDLYSVFDAANFRYNDADIDRGIEVSMRRPAYAHIKDAVYNPRAIVPSGEGEGKIGDLIDALDRTCDSRVTLTIEPHLAIFDGYSKIDTHTLKGRYTYESNDAAFDTAVSALKRILTEKGYREGEGHVWKK